MQEAGAGEDAWMNLEPMEHEFDLSQVQRPFRFGEFFAGFAGFTRTLEELGGTLVETTNPQDHYEGWDILTDEGLEQGLSVCETLDHGHFALLARRSPRPDALTSLEW